MNHKEQGKRLRLARQAAGLTQTRLGRMAGVTKQTVWNFELGHKAILPSTAERLEQAIADYVGTQKIAASLYAQREQQAVEQEIERLEQRAAAFRKFQQRYSEAQWTATPTATSASRPPSPCRRKRSPIRPRRRINPNPSNPSRSKSHPQKSTCSWTYREGRRPRLAKVDVGLVSGKEYLGATIKYVERYMIVVEVEGNSIGIMKTAIASVAKVG